MEPKAKLPTDELAAKTELGTPDEITGNSSREVSDSPFSVFGSAPEKTASKVASHVYSEGNAGEIAAKASKPLAPQGTVALDASSNPCPITAPGGTCTITVSWSLSDSPTAQVWVTSNGGPATLFACNSSGAVAVPWIQANVTYEFSLYGSSSCNSSLPFGPPLKKIIVTGQAANTIAATPNPCFPATGSQVCTSTISWTTVSTNAQVWVSSNGGSATLFACNPSGAIAVPWINPANSYEFDLYSVSSCTESVSQKQPLAKVNIPASPSPVNLALGKTATQSSTFVNGGITFSADRAVNGGTSGDFLGGNTTTATNNGYQSWWQVDLGSSQSIGSIDIWGRTDCCPEQTSNFYVLVSDQPFASTDLNTARNQTGVSSYYFPGFSGTPGTVAVNRRGRYVRVQLAGSQYLVLAEVKVWQAGSTAAVPRDGISSLSYDTATNRITNTGFSYDAAGNQTRAVAPYGGSQKFQYDAANRLANVKTDAGVLIATYTYGEGNQRLVADESGLRTYYVDDIAEYMESGGSTSPAWSKSYVYLGERLLSTLEPNGSGGEVIQYHHPDRLGTRLVTNAQDATYFEQQSLPFGTALNESPNSGATTGSTQRRFTSYDRSVTTGLDYANNRHYDSQQGRFTQVDPVGMGATSLESPQTLNLYAYCTNDPINHTDPSGLGFFSFLKKAFKWIAVAVVVALAVAAIVLAPESLTVMQGVFNAISAIASGASSVLNALGFAKAGGILGIISAAASLGVSTIAAHLDACWKTVLKVVSDGAALASKTLTAVGYKKLGQIFDLASSVAGFISNGIDRQPINDPSDPRKIIGHTDKWAASAWDTYKFVRGTGEQIATIAGGNRAAGILNVFGFADDAADLYIGIHYFNTVKNDYVKHPRENMAADIKRYDVLVPPGAVRDRLAVLLRRQSRLQTLKGLVGNVNNIFGRVDKVIASAH